jgi:hypothetical protein
MAEAQQPSSLVMPGYLTNTKTLCTSKDYFGNEYQALRDGDMICAVFGFKLVVVLRRVGWQWKFVEACYDHGLMKGEIMEILKKGELVED